MKLRAYDQMNISSVRPDTIRPGEEFEVSDATGEELMKAHPGKFADVSAADKPAAKRAAAPSNKAEPAPDNKADDAPTPISARRVPRDA